MSFFSWLRNRTATPTHRERAQPRAAAPRFRPGLEPLEERALLSSYTAASVSELIADITAANKAGGPNTITLTAPTTSPYVLTAVNNTTNGANGLPVITSKKGDNLTLLGNGDTIERSTAAVAFRLFDVASGSSLTLQNLTLQSGLAQGTGSAADGGAIYSQGSLTLNGATVLDNVAQGSNGTNGVVVNKLKGSQSINGQAGADAAGGGIWSSGSVTLEGGTILQGNQARGGAGGAAGEAGSSYGNGGAGGGGFGGGLYEAGGSVNASNATLSGNSALGGAGGGQQTAPGSAATSAPANITGSGGKGSGGGLYVAGGTLAMSSATVQSNRAGGGAGGNFYYYAAIAEPGGEGSGGGISVVGGTVQLDAIALLANNAVGGAPGNSNHNFPVTPTESAANTANGGNSLGGGLYVSGGIVTLTGDTVSGNEAWGPVNGAYVLRAGGPGVGEGAGIYNLSGTVTVSNSTVSDNVATLGAGPGPGSGIYNAAAGTLYVINQSTVTDNYAGDLYNLGTADVSSDSDVGVIGP